MKSVIRRLLRARGPGKTICPSEVAREVAPDDWRSRMDAVREVAAKMADAGELVVTQRGKPVDIRTARGAVRLASASASDPWRGIDFRAHPEAYRVGRGEQGVLTAEPYKSELLPLWRFRTEDVAKQSSKALWQAFVAYRKARDFVGMDMARKFLQMGYTRARRYANHASGRKYDRQTGAPLPRAGDDEKARAAAVFYEIWQRAERDRVYAAWRRRVSAAS